MLNLQKECTNNIFIKETGVNKIIPELSEKIAQDYSYLKYYDITSTMGLVNKKQNAFILAGEHARELISSEFMLYFIQKLCQNIDNNKGILSSINLRVIINANPNGRIKVENGEYCKRTNSNDVDINRNWDIFWGKDTNNSEENPGNKAFSEIETKFIHRSINNFNAKLFLSIHSGVYGLYLPYAYTNSESFLNHDNMIQILTETKNKYCSTCQLGSPSKLIGYKSSGTCLDYIYDKLKVPYSLAWEIYSNETILPELELKRISPQINKNSNLKKIYTEFNKNSFISTNEEINLKNKFDPIDETSNFLKKYSRVYTEADNDMCANLFNPTDKLSYDFILNNWTHALLDLLKYVKSH